MASLWQEIAVDHIEDVIPYDRWTRLISRYRDAWSHAATNEKRTGCRFCNWFV